MENQEIDFNQIYNELVSQCESGIQNRDSQLLAAFLNDKRVVLFKDRHEDYVILRQMRAEAFAMFGKFVEGGKEYRMAIPYAEKDDVWFIYLKWCQHSFLSFSYAKSEEEKEQILSACLDLADKGSRSVTGSVDLGYRRMAFANLRAFCFTFLGKKEDALKEFDPFLFKPIPIPQYNDTDQLTFLIGNYTKALAVAIELKNETLLRKLLKVISIDDQTLYGETNLFKIFHVTLLNTIDTRPEFANEFNGMFRLIGKLGPNFAGFDYFLTSIQGSLFAALDTFFQEFKK